MPPKLVFIVPYKNREHHKVFFEKYMEFVLEDVDKKTYEIYFSHQTDNRKFNRGAVKNIGFLAIKKKYPMNYKNITFVFNDIDTVPCNKNILDFNTVSGTVKHFYGYKFCLGGIVSITGGDFEKMNGYPNYWEWSGEDNCLQKRAQKENVNIDRSQFYQIGDSHILQLFDGIHRQINLNNIDRTNNDNGIDGLKMITNLKYKIDGKMINIDTFMVPLSNNEKNVIKYDIRKGSRIVKQDYIKDRNSRMKLSFF
jgi:hypothetical protein